MTSFPLKKTTVIGRDVLEEKLDKIEEKGFKKPSQKLSKALIEQELSKVEKSDERTFIKSDPWKASLISLYLTNQINPSIGDEELNKFIEHYEEYGYVIKQALHRRIVPIQKKNYKWIDYPSRQLRNRFRLKVDELMSLLSQLSNVSIKNYVIDARGVYEEELISDQFGDLAGFSLKKAKKRKSERSGVSLLFNRSYSKSRESNIIFFVSTHDEKHKKESESSGFLLDNVLSLVENYRGFSSSPQDLIKDFVMEMNVAIAREFSHKASLFFGMRFNGSVFYTLMGNLSLYSYNGEDFELIERGSFPLGENVQIIKQRGCNRVVNLLSKESVEVKELNLKDKVALLITTSNLEKAINGKRRIRFKAAPEFIERLLKRSRKLRNMDSGALFFYV